MYRIILSVSQKYIPAIIRSFQYNYPNYTIDFVNSKELPANCSKIERNISEDALFICDRDMDIERIKTAFIKSGKGTDWPGTLVDISPDRVLIPVIAFSHEDNKTESLFGAPYMILSPEGLTPELIEEVRSRSYGRPLILAKSDRCILRELYMKDLPDLLLLQEENKKNPGGCFFPENCAAPDQFLASYISRQYYYYGFGLFAVCQADTGNLTGIAGFSCTDLPGVDVEASYALLKKYQHRGYAREAMNILLQEAPTRWQLNHIAVRIGPDNPASLKLAGELGMQVCPVGD